MTKIIRNGRVVTITIFMFIIIDIGAGIRRTISMSNTRKITAKRKNRIENGIRAEELGSKPHSNGVALSRSVFFFVERENIANIIANGITIAIVVRSIELIISLE